MINACKRLGPETRRIVERNHAQRRLEYNFLKGPLKDLGEDQAVFFKLWDRFCDSRSFLDADVMRKEIRKKFEKHPGYETMMKHLQIYFDDPQIICYYGRSDMPDLPAMPVNYKMFEFLPASLPALLIPVFFCITNF